MTEKVKLPKAVCDALDKVKVFSVSKGYELDYKLIITMYLNRNPSLYFEPVLEQDFNIIIRALVLGYEAELTAEEQIKNLYFGCSKSFADDEIYRCGVRDALRIHGIKYDWLEGDAE